MTGRLVLLLIGAVSLAGARAPLNCMVPNNLQEGCAACYRCEVKEEPTGEIVGYRLTETINHKECEEFCERYGIPATEYLCNLMGFYERKETPVYSTAEVCSCNSTAVVQNCVDSNHSSFIIESPRACSKDPSNIICHWNLPQADQVYMHLLEQDIEGNPNDGDTGCKDKLIVKSTDLAEDLTTCGSLPYTRPATKIYNSVYSKVPNVFFSSDDMESSSFKILLVYLSRKLSDMKIRGNSISRNSMPRGGAVIDVHSPPAFSPFTTCCECPKVNIRQMCPSGGLENNIVFQKLLQESVNPSSPCLGIGKTGFSGLKGCIGAEFLTRGSPPSNLTREECENMQLGMTDEERSAFLERGSALWCGCSSPSSSTFCMDGIPATRPNAKELIKLEGLLAGHVKATECASSDNAVLRTVSEFLLTSQQVPVLTLSDNIRC